MNFDVRLNYLTKVLGLNFSVKAKQKVMSLKNKASAMGAVEKTTEGVSQEWSLPVIVACSTHWTTEGQILVSKMMSALGIQEYFFHDKIDAEMGKDAHWVIFGDLPVETKHKFLKLSEIEKYFPPYTETEIQKLKKETWSQLKNFKQEVFK